MKYVPNRGGLRDLLRGQVAQNLVRRHTDQLAAAAGDGFVGSTRQGKSRFRGIVFAESWSAKRREAKHNVLLRVLR